MTPKSELDTAAPTTQSAIHEEKKTWGESIKSLLVLVIFVLAIRWTVASPYYVPTSSMEPTIKVGDRLLAWKLAYNFKIPFTDTALFTWGEPSRGDIIVFKYPRDTSIDYVKRVVAVAGDEVQVRDDI